MEIIVNGIDEGFLLFFFFMLPIWFLVFAYHDHSHQPIEYVYKWEKQENLKC